MSQKWYVQAWTLVGWVRWVPRRRCLKSLLPFWPFLIWSVWLLLKDKRGKKIFFKDFYQRLIPLINLPPCPESHMWPKREASWPWKHLPKGHLQSRTPQAGQDSSNIQTFLHGMHMIDSRPWSSRGCPNVDVRLTTVRPPVRIHNKSQIGPKLSNGCSQKWIWKKMHFEMVLSDQSQIFGTFSFEPHKNISKIKDQQHCHQHFQRNLQTLSSEFHLLSRNL